MATGVGVGVGIGPFNDVAGASGPLSAITSSNGAYGVAALRGKNRVPLSELTDTASWVEAGVQTIATTSPAGQLIEDSSTGLHRVYQQSLTVDGGTEYYTLSARVSANGRDAVYIGLNNTPAFPSGIYAHFDMGDGTWSNIGSDVIAYGETDLGGGEWRIWLQGKTKASPTGSAYCDFRLISGGTTSYTGTTPVGSI